VQAGPVERVKPGVEAVVVGGGLAGAAAAAVLAERGVEVTLLERQGFLGGRVSGWTDRLSDGTPFEMERGFHAFFRQYYNLRRFLERIDPGLHNLLALDDYPLLGPGGQSESFADLPKTTPFNVMELVRRTPRMDFSDMVRVAWRPALEMFAYDPEKTYERYDDVTAKEYLDSLGFPPAARQMLFDVFAHSFFNPEERFSAADLLMMFHFYFIGNPEGLIFDVLEEPFSICLWQPMARYLEGLGVRILTDRTATGVEMGSDGRFRVRIEERDEPTEGDGLVLAVDVPSLKKLFDESPDLQNATSLSDSVASLDVTLPFAVWRLWMERPPRPERAPFAGTTGLGDLDNISIYERFEGESRRWALENGGSVVELHAYAVSEHATEAQIRKDLEDRLEEAYPEMRSVGVLEDRFLLKRDCPSFAPSMSSRRPGVATEVEGLALAGDFVRLDFPSALMERAAASGMMAANHLLKRWNGRPEPIHSVPARGFLSFL
jgi:isorenieratene synthase